MLTNYRTKTGPDTPLYPPGILPACGASWQRSNHRVISEVSFNGCHLQQLVPRGSAFPFQPILHNGSSYEEMFDASLTSSRFYECRKVYKHGWLRRWAYGWSSTKVTLFYFIRNLEASSGFTYLSPEGLEGFKVLSPFLTPAIHYQSVKPAWVIFDLASYLELPTVCIVRCSTHTYLLLLLNTTNALAY